MSISCKAELINRSMPCSDHNDAEIRMSENKESICKLKLNKSDGIFGLQSDHFFNADDDLHVH